MKKLITLLIALVLCLGAASAAMAEEAEPPRFYWEDKAEEAAAQDGSFYTLDELGLRFWVPDYMQLQELTDEQRERNNIARFMNDEETDYLVITLVESDRTYDDVYNLVQERGMEGGKAYVNDLPVVLYHYVRDDNSASDCAAFVTDDGRILEFVFTGDDDTFKLDSGITVSSIQLVESQEPEPTEPEMPAFSWEICVQDMNVDEGCFYTLNQVGVKVWIPNYMSVRDLDETAIQKGFIARFVNAEQTCAVGVTLASQDMTYDKYYDFLVNYGVQNPFKAYINDLPIIAYHYVRGENDESDVISLVMEDGQVLEFVFTGNDSPFVTDAPNIRASIQLADPEAAEQRDVPTYAWEDNVAALEEAGIEGDFYKLANVNIAVWIPSFLELQELSDEDVDSGYIAKFVNEDGSNYVFVTLTELDVDYSKGMEMLKEGGAENISEATVNGLPIVCYSYINNDSGRRNAAILFTDDGYGLNFDFSAGDETFDSYCRSIVISIQLAD